ncbi:MAG: S1 RNA-binding domain-containing protein [Chloroflexi bacterium]|nr:S1 RNA-binding domain-containing protein [Chloroflexota bacterium]
MTTTETDQPAGPGNVAVLTDDTDQQQDAEQPIPTEPEQSSENGDDVNGEVEELDLVFSYLPKERLRRGDIIDGIVLDAARDGLLVDIQQKSEGWVPIRETRLLTEEEGDESLPDIGDEVILYVSRPEGPDGYPLLSIDRARGEHGWRDLEKAREAEETVKGRIIGSNRGGAVIQVKGVQGFVPLSQLVGPARDLYVGDGAPPKPGFIGMEIDCKILELNRRRNRAIFSERAALEAINHMQKMRLVQELEEGDIRRGRVAGISSFGAFIDLGGADGLVHISEMSWSSVNRPDDVVKLGQDLDVLVLKVDRESLKIALSMKRLLPEPWENIENQLSVGQVVEGKVTKLAHFGAFARVGEGIEGLVHISELTNRHIKSPSEVVKEGDVHNFRVIRIEPERRRLGLSLKQVEGSQGSPDARGGSDGDGSSFADGGFEDLFDD